MAQRQLFQARNGLGITKYWHYDDDTDTAVIESVYDAEPLFERAQKQRNAVTSLDRMGDGAQHVGYIPMHVYGNWLAQGIDKDQNVIRKWLNDPENQRYRSRKCRV